MFHLPRPRSTLFRLTLGLALLAWTALAFGAPPMTEASHVHASQSQPQITNGATHCHGAMMVSAGLHAMSVPMTATGHGDCCQTACRCLAASAVVMTVPRVFVAFIPPHGDWSAGSKTPVPPAPAAQPLRPPIG